MKASLLAVFALGLLAPLHAAKKPVTIAAVASGHFPRVPSPLWRSDGHAFAYRENGKVYLYDVAAHKAKEWFSLGALDGGKPKPEASAPQPHDWQDRYVKISGMQWFEDGKAMLVPTRGGLYVVPEGKAAARESIDGITEDNAPTLSPDGRLVLFRRDNNLFVLNLASKKVRQLTTDGSDVLMNGRLDWVYPEELEIATAYWWSPDSKQIAYLQFDVSHEFMYPHEDLLGVHALYEPERYPQSGTANAQVKVGVAAAGGGPTTWLETGDTSNTLIARVNWLPHANEIAIERFNRVQNHLDFLLADAASGSVRTLFSEDDKTWINVNNDLYFFRSKPEFLWASERSGYRHLYLYSNTGELIRQLTNGDWQVNRVAAVDEEAGMVYFTSTQASPLEDQLYRVSLDGGAPLRLTQGAGTHSVQVSSGGHAYLDTFSNLTTPPETTLHDSSGAQMAVFRGAAEDTSEFEILPTQIVPVTLASGEVLYARLIKPKNFEPDWKYPAIVFVYGGPHAQAVHNVWQGVSWEQVLAQRGYVIWQLDNRGAYGRSHIFESPIYREMGRTELSDQRAGVAALLAMGFVDKNRIGITGWSYGGYMTLYAMLHAPDLFKVGVAGAPVTDWHNYDTIYTERYMGLPAENAEGYRKSSNVLAAGNLEGKLMMVCNFEDDNVLFQNTMQMISALHEAGKQFEFMLYPQKTHGVTGSLRENLYQGMTDFFERNLKRDGE